MPALECAARAQTVERGCLYSLGWIVHHAFEQRNRWIAGAAALLRSANQRRTFRSDSLIRISKQGSECRDREFSQTENIYRRWGRRRARPAGGRAPAFTKIFVDS